MGEIPVQRKAVNLSGNQPGPSCLRSLWIAAEARSPGMGKVTPHPVQFSWRRRMLRALPRSLKGSTSSGRVTLGGNTIRVDRKKEKNLVYIFKLSQKFDFQPLVAKLDSEDHPTIESG